MLGQCCLTLRAGLPSASTGQTGENKLACGRGQSGSTLPSAVRYFRPLNNPETVRYLDYQAILQLRCCICQLSEAR